MGLGVAILGVTAVWRPVPLLIWNASASAPTGLYAVQRVGRLADGELVVAQPPDGLAAFLAERGYLPRPLPLIKHVAALPGEIVCEERGVVSIAGRVVARALQRDHLARVLPIWSGCGPLEPGEVFLLNPARSDSMDARYFGPLPSRVIIGRAVPLLTGRQP
jgi:conjugative transfer signal peptidase TraF